MVAHLAHLLRVERLYVDRARRALTDHEPLITSSGLGNDDDPARAQHLAVPQIIHGMQAIRRDLDALLSGCDDLALARAIRHEVRGRITVREIAVKMVEHEDDHAGAVAALVRRAPSSGRVIIPLSRRS